MRTYTLLLIAALLTSLLGCTSSRDSSRHWKRIDEYNEYIRNPKNQKRDEELGLGYVDNVPDIMPNLHALAQMGEIIHLDLVFPNVPQTREVTTYWMIYVHDIPEIIYAMGYALYRGDDIYRPKGVQLVHIQLWFKPTAEEKVKELIGGIEKFGENKEEPSTTE